ncbi:MAG: translocation/assembly module TamB domain-containing protein [Negativicutes bacterium]|nr:translocation/assembly module TamB domain-containing protein [Negativicutes bacterium]
MKIKAVVVITLVVIAFAVATAWQNKSQDILAGIRDIAVAEVADATGASVQFGNLEVLSLNTIIVEDVYVYDKEAKLIASSPKVSVGYSLLSLLFGQKTEMIKNITVDQPFLTLVQKTGGRWNFEDIIEDQSSQSSFAGKIVLNGGQAEIISADGQWTLMAVNGSLDFASRLSTAINLSTVYKEAPLTVSGSLNTGGDGVLSVTARNLPLFDLAPLLNDTAVQVLGGTADTVDATVKKTGDDLSFAGQAEFSAVDVDADSVPIRDANGLATFNNERLYIFTKAQVWNQPVTAKGKIAINTGQPVLDLRVSSNGFDPAVVQAGLPLSGLVTFDAAVTGSIDNLAIDGDLGLAEGELNGISLKDIAAQFSLFDKKINIQELTGSAAGGQVAATGTVGLENNQYDVHIKANGVDSAAFGQSGLNGLADVDINAAGVGFSIADATVYGTAQLTGGQVQGIGFNRAESSFHLANSQLILDYATISLDGGSVTANGVVSPDHIGLNLRGHQVPLSLLTALDRNINIDGSADFTGTVSGTTATPNALLDFTATSGQVFYQPFAYAQGRLELSPTVVTLYDVSLNDGPTTHKVTGTMGLAGTRPLNLKISSRQARAENIVKLLLPGEKLTGNVDNELTITGPLDSFNAAGQIKLTEGSFRGQLIASAHGSYRRENGLTSISDFVINSLNTEVKIAGIIRQDQDLDLTIDAQHIDLGRLHLNLPYELAGKAAFSGRLTGTPTQPLFSGRLVADRLVFKNYEISQVSGDIQLVGDSIEIPQFKFVQGEGTYNFAGGLNLVTGGIYGGIDVEKGDLAALLAILNVPGNDVSGQINGHIVISGTTAKPNVTLTGGILGGKVKNYPLDTVDIDASLANNVITVNRFFAKQGNGVLAVQGSADLNGPLSFEAGGRDIDAGLLSALFNSDVDVKGNLGFAAQVSGTMANPRADVSLEIGGGGVGSSTFDSLYGLVILQDDNININQLFLTKGANRASAYGVIPVAALSSEGRRQATLADQMDVKVRLDQADLSILPMLTKEVSWAAGKTQGELTIGGTIMQPYLTGSINVTDGTVKLAKLNDPIQKVALDIQFKGDKIVLKTFSGHMGSGSYQMAGSTALTGLAFTDYDFQLKLDNLGVNSKYFKGPLNGDLALTSNRGRPLLAGTLLFENNTIDIPFISDFTESDLNIRLNVELIAGKKVRFYNSYMYDIWAEGRIKFEGSTKRPNPSGKITAIRGTVSYLRTSFKIKEASAEFNQFGTFEPVLRLTASTKLQDTTVDLNLNGPVSAMDLQLTAEPAMSQQDIITLLTLRSRYFEKQSSGSGANGSGFGRDELVGLLDAGLQMRFVSTVEGIFRDAFGLDDFRVVRDTLWSNGRQRSNEDREGPSNQEVYNVEMGKYITDRLMLNYTMGLDNDRYSYGFRYDLNRRISLTGLVDDQDDKRIGIEARFKF